MASPKGMSKQPSFLRLPYEIRRRSYILLRLLGGTYPPGIRSFRGEWWACEQRFIDDDIGLTYFCNWLFYVSRAISEDVRAAFYFENTLHSYEMQDLLTC
jgi:hypothetical protein